jgi:DNA-binding CsgD family transcriptional regulator
MTALCETENIVRGFGQGAVDYLTKPVRKEEVLARISTHISRSRELRRAEQTVEALPRPSMRVDADGGVTWMSGRAQSIAPAEWWPRCLPQGVCDWLAQRRRGTEGVRTVTLEIGGQRFVIEYCGEVGAGEALVFFERAGAPAVEPLLLAFGLTPREAEVLRWVAAGKTNRDIGEILGSSPRTVTKHLEHVFAKLGVETRTAAATRALAILGPQLA